MSWRPDDFDDLAGELRRRVGHEFREEAEEVERLSDLQRRRRATLADVALDAMHRGDAVTVRSAAATWTGELTAVGDDYLSLRAVNVIIEVPLDAIALEVVASRAGGRSGRPASLTWKARLAELATSGEVVTLLAPDLGVEVTGPIELVARDHVVVSGGTAKSYIPLGSQTILLRSLPR